MTTRIRYFKEKDKNRLVSKVIKSEKPRARDSYGLIPEII